jgi:hypothetical protein
MRVSFLSHSWMLIAWSQSPFSARENGAGTVGVLFLSRFWMLIARSQSAFSARVFSVSPNRQDLCHSVPR